jgi:exopolysaccharide biosynthesis polyprenyl glycosylphosphotransferase
MKRKIWKTASIILYPILDWVCVFGSCLLSYNIYYYFELGKQVAYGETEYIMISFIAALVVLIALQLNGAYHRESSLLNVAEIRSVIKGITLSFLLYVLLTFSLRVTHSRYMVVMAFLFSIVSVVTGRTVLYHFHPYLNQRFVTGKRVLIYGAGEVGQALYQAIMDSPRLNIQPVGFIDDDTDKKEFSFNCCGFNTKQNIKVLGDYNKITHLVPEHRIDAIFVAISGIDHKVLNAIILRCKSLGIGVQFIPNLYKSFSHGLRVVQIGPFPMITEAEPNKDRYKFIKRVSDFILALLMVILLTPIWFVIALLIKIDTKGPILFKHDRVGRDGKLFKMYKFRSMYADEPAYAINPTSKDDHRVTRVGRIIRRISFDELPQLLNVLKGDMSIVGPRPEMPFIVEQYEEFHRKRLKVMPGITGLWQLSGDRDKPIHENMDYDLYYIRNQSFSLDLAILIETLIFAFRGV